MKQKNSTIKDRQGQQGQGFMGPGKMSMVAQKPKNFKKSLKQLALYLKPYWLTIIVSLIFASLSITLSIIGPKILAKITEEIIKGLIPNSNINFEKIATIGYTLIIMFVVSALLSFVQRYMLNNVGAKISQNLRSDISKQINNLPLNYFDKHSYGDILSRITNDVDTLSNTLKQGLSTLIYSFTAIIGIVVMMLSINISLTMIALITIPVNLIIVGMIVKFSQKYFKAHQQQLGDINGLIEEVYTNHNVVKVYNGEKSALSKFEVINNDIYKSGFKSNFFSGLMMPAMNFISNIGYVAIIIIGASISLKNPLFIASLLAFIQYIRRFNEPVGELASVFGTLQSTVAASERVFEFLDQPQQSDESKKTKTVKKIEGNIEFKNIEFGYNKDKIIIPNFSLKVKAGQKIAIVGPTGAGKTTLVNLLMKFYEIDKGDILFDGVSIHDISRNNIRKLFAMVLQDTWLFEGTVSDNLKFSNPNATQEEVENACKHAEIDHFIRTLPGGYDMMLSDGNSISQGQKQLLTIARAMLQNAPMLILDEATSSVDTRTEILIQKAMDKLMKGKTSFIIAHRLSTIKNADVILVLKDGDIVEQGNHYALIKKQGFYYDLYNSQFSKKYKEENQNI